MHAHPQLRLSRGLEEVLLRLLVDELDVAHVPVHEVCGEVCRRCGDMTCDCLNDSVQQPMCLI